ncbi:MAG: DUF1501 domain-containing protein [Planctomycetaceae bacterium]|nr:DUF1501 domain-containing protein [Planctomycetaceae bacterium]
MHDQHCNHRRSRRDILRIGALGVGGLSLARLLRAAEASDTPRHKSIINVHLDGGPPQHETIDPKPHAPAEIRGEFSPIATSLPGVQISELMPQLASRADRVAFIRTLVGSDGKHHAFQCQSGFLEKDLQSLGGRPAMGSILSHLYGRPDDPAPTFVDLMQGRPLVRNSARPGFLGPAYQPFRPDLSHLFQRELEAGMKGELARLGSEHSLSLTLDPSLTLERLGDRHSLVADFDAVRRQVDASGMMEAMDRFQQQAIGILTSGRLAQALDLTREDPRIVARYNAPAAAAGTQSYTSEGSNAPLKFLLARRLIEAGVRMVSVSISDFDTHSDNFARMRHLVPIVDHGLHALITDLESRGMLDDVTIVAWGEFGRTPRVNANGGRDHWPRVGPCLLAGGGLRTGCVIGETDREAAAAIARPVHYKDVFATLYHTLGIDARQVTLTDPQGRPQYLLDDGAPLPELV